MNIVRSTRAYERWLKTQLRGDIVKKDIKKKHKDMRGGAFPFLRATYWRWAETILDVCPELKTAPRVLAVGDIHLENFGTWRDVDGRLVWGVNDFDEAAKMPYALDLVRLATSAALAVRSVTAGAITSSILRGYREGLAAPHAFVLDQRYRALRELFEVPEEERTKFWNDKMDPEKNLKRAHKLKRTKPPRPFAEALNKARPEPDVDFVFWPRTAGLGSLGRPRWIGHGLWRAAPVVREAKAIVPSAWVYVHGGSRRLRCQEIATGKYRAPDPWYELRNGHVLVRRLSPNNRKLEAKKKKENEVEGPAEGERVSDLVNPAMLRDMGRDLAAVHLGTGSSGKVITRDLKKRKPRWLHDATMAAAAAVRRDYQEWCKPTE